MALAETTAPVALAAGKQNWIGKYWGLVAACAVLILNFSAADTGRAAACRAARAGDLWLQTHAAQWLAALIVQWLASINLPVSASWR